jgi:hypothetical protein
VVVVDHGATRTTYEPVSAVVRVGQAVLQGQRLGTLEPAGSHCLPAACLLWGWRRGDTYLDPLLLVGGGPIRLLPQWRSDPVARAPVWQPPALPYAAVLARLLATTAPVRSRDPTPRALVVPETTRAMRPLLL